MKKFTREQWAAASAAGIGCGVLTYGLLLAILRKGFESPEAAGWIQAIGSVATIVAAMYIWMGDRRERRQDDEAIALVASVSMSHRVTIFGDEIEDCVRLLVTLEGFNYQRDNLESLYERLDALPEWTVEEIHRLSPLGDCAINLARAQYSTHAAIRIFKEVLNSSRYANQDYLYDRMGQATDFLRRAEWNIDEAHGNIFTEGNPGALP